MGRKRFVQRSVSKDVIKKTVCQCLPVIFFTYIRKKYRFFLTKVHTQSKVLVYTKWLPQDAANLICSRRFMELFVVVLLTGVLLSILIVGQKQQNFVMP